MSTGYAAIVVYGMPFEKACRVETSEALVTKYDVDTGKPYQKPVTVKRYFFFGKEITGEDFFGFDYDFFEELEPEELNKFCSGNPDYKRADEMSIVGVSVAEVPIVTDNYIPIPLPDDHQRVSRIMQEAGADIKDCDYYLLLTIS